MPRYLRRKGSPRKEDGLLPAVCLRQIHIPQITVPAALFNLIQIGYHHKYLEEIEIPEPEPNDRKHYGRVHLADVSARERRKNFEPVEMGMSFEEAMQECGKCLRCDHFGCGSVIGGGI